MVVKLKNFKCFVNESVEIKPLTILTGANSAGKSTIIQALLLFSHVLDLERISKVDHGLVNLRNVYGLDFGNYEDILNKSVASNESIAINVDGVLVELKSNDSAPFYIIKYNIVRKLAFMHTDHFNVAYLDSDRIGVKGSSINYNNDIKSMGVQGEFTIDLISLNNNLGSRLLINLLEISNYKFEDNLNKMIDFMFPEYSIRTSYDIKSNNFTLKFVKFDAKTKEFKESLPSNVGSGLYYVLPILAILLLNVGSSPIVIQNPEIHLHPGAQTMLGWLIAEVVVKSLELGITPTIVIETHSEHIINGIQWRILQAANNGLGKIVFEKFVCYFLSNGIVENIIINEDGELEPFPDFFFDQLSRDYYHIKVEKLKLKSRD